MIKVVWFSPAQIVKILIALAVFCTFGLQFFVCLEIVWDGIKERFVKRPTLVNYVTRYEKTIDLWFVVVS